jgi:GNAT superfamily N-acetyltransferase
MPEVVPFADEHLEAAAELLAARHRRQRRSEPLLPARFEDAAEARVQLERAWRTEDASGAAALDGGRLVGYLVGAPRANPVWGDNVWVETGGHATEDPELAGDLYGFAAARWVDAGRTRQYALLPAGDDALIDAWFRLSFGLQQVHALREVGAVTRAAVRDGVEIRAPRADEIESLIEIDLALPHHQRTSPVFSSVPLPTREELRDEWRSTLAGDEETVLVGAVDGRPVACWALVPAERSGHDHTLIGNDACYLGFAATLPEARGSGIGVALTEAALGWAESAGYSVMVTDWRSTNLLASRFWPRRGFRPAFYRLYRHIP